MAVLLIFDFMNAGKVDPKNRLNDLDSKSWLKFQKSWFHPDSTTPDAFIRFFTKARYPDDHTGTVLYYPSGLYDYFSPEVRQSRRLYSSSSHSGAMLDYIYFDVVAAGTLDPGVLLSALKRLRQGGYLTVVVRNVRRAGRTLPVAWNIAKWIGRYLTIKDEKIGCLTDDSGARQLWPEAWDPEAFADIWTPADDLLYFMNFRREAQTIPDEWPDLPETTNFSAVPDETSKTPATGGSGTFRKAWFVHKPPPRSEQVLLHPAKFPEDLVQKFVENFTDPGQWVLDPMAGTGSSLVAAAACGRCAFGIELNPEFAQIARSRFQMMNTIQMVMGDARDPASYALLPQKVDYCITSPPYWDMLRMRGAETQRKRKAAGLPRWYSDDARDLGNIANYGAFLDRLTEVYRQVIQHIKPGGYCTIIVKNVKKGGRMYPLAWDLVHRMQPFCQFVGEQIWCQDDQRLAPFGYRYAWVSNTFHHYCLTFRKPAETG